MGCCVDLFINLDNLPSLVNDDGHTAARAIWVVRCAEQQAQVTSGIHEKREVQAVLFDELFVRFSVLDTDTKDLRIVAGKLARLIPERADFCRSATGEIFGVKRQNNVLFPFELTELIRFAALIGSDEIGGSPSHINLFRDAFLNELGDIRAMRLHVHVPIDCADISSLIDDEGGAIGGFEFFHDAAVNFADGELLIGEKWKPEFFFRLKLHMGFLVINTNT